MTILHRILLVLTGLVLAGLGWSLWGRDDSFARRGVRPGLPDWPSLAQLERTVFLADYNTRVVFLGVTALGAVGGLVGTFLLLRKRSLLSDTVSHATLPGLAMAFLFGEATSLGGRSLSLLLAGAAVSGTLGMVTVATLRAKTRLKDDAALAIVLSVFFGFGLALLGVIQQLPSGNAAGLTHFIYGKTSAMTAGDARLIVGITLMIGVVCLAFFKEFKLVCFDENYARSQGWPTFLIDVMLMALVVGVTVIGLQAVGLLLVVALMIIPAAAARFWSHSLGITAVLSTAIGAMSGMVGVVTSALFPKLPAGAVIVLAAVVCFAVSFVFGARRGVLTQWLEQRRMSGRVARLHFLRAVYEWCEQGGHDLEARVSLAELKEANLWSERTLRTLLALAMREGLISAHAAVGTCQLTARGKSEARRETRNHRLWEMYLLHYADVAPQHIHHNADHIEHVVDPQIMNRLEELLAHSGPAALVPPDPERTSAIRLP
jgi:manganese/zinc/iron transport system permease protein